MLLAAARGLEVKLNKKNIMVLVVGVIALSALSGTGSLLAERIQLEWLRTTVVFVPTFSMIGCLMWINNSYQYKKAEHRIRGKRALRFLLIFVLVLWFVSLSFIFARFLLRR